MRIVFVRHGHPDYPRDCLTTPDFEVTNDSRHIQDIALDTGFGT